MEFPKQFVWGAASSSYQTEGNRSGRGDSIWDEFCTRPGAIRNNETGDIACDGLRRFREDVRLLKQLGLSAYRFSLSWPRIFPDGRGEPNRAGLDYYDDLIDLLLAEGITPYVTLYHWDLPLALERQGGWRCRETALAFAEYAGFVARHFAGRVRHYCTLNEPQCFIGLGYGTGEHAPGVCLEGSELFACAANALLAHGLAVQAIRQKSEEPIQIGVASTGKLCYPLHDTAENRAAAERASFLAEGDRWWFTHTWFLDAILLGSLPPELQALADSIPQEDWAIIRQPLDFLGVNVYNGTQTDERGEYADRIPGFPRTALKWPVTPQVMRYGSRWLYRRYHLPMYITENGQSCNDRIFLDGKVHDPDRIDFLHRYLLELRECCAEGVPIKGYFHWSLTDNFEWNNGYDERMGLVYLHYPTQHRIVKDSAEWYARTAQTNGRLL